MGVSNKPGSPVRTRSQAALTNEGVSALQKLAEAAGARMQADADTSAAVAAARRAGVTWVSIGRLLGISKQAAAAKYSAAAALGRSGRTMEEWALF